MTINEVRKIELEFNGIKSHDFVIIKEILNNEYVLVSSVERIPKLVKCHVTQLMYANEKITNECITFMKNHGNM